MTVAGEDMAIRSFDPHCGLQDVLALLRRGDAIFPVRIPGLELQITTNCALTDFTAENGATQVIFGSHQWQEPGGS